MAMEQVEVPSRSYFIRWVDCAAGHTISWSIRPDRKSLNFGIFKHPGTGAQLQPSPTGRSEETTIVGRDQRPSSSAARTKSNEGDAIDRLHAAGLLDIYWHGKCEAEKVTTGSYQVKGQGGMFALVFDNTFSKQISKTATLVLMTYPSNTAPPASHALHHFDSSNTLATTASSITTSNKATPVLTSHQASSVETMSVHAQEGPLHDDVSVNSSSGFFTGVLKKRKRKKHQGYARRFFSLDFTSSTLSYYLNRDSSSLRGAIPLSLAAISASEKDREICIDSGAEIWHLRANSDLEWKQWKSALEKAARQAAKASTVGDFLEVPTDSKRVEAGPQQILEDQGWAGVEALVGRVAGVRDAVRRLTEARHGTTPTSFGLAGSEASASKTSLVSTEREQKRPFWKRKASGNSAASTPPLSRSNRDGPTARPGTANTSATMTSALISVPAPPNGASGALHSEQDMTMHLDALLTDLDSVVKDFSGLISENKQRIWLSRRKSDQNIPISASRISMESSASEEFFDAEEMEGERGKVVMFDDNDSAGREDESGPDAVTDDEESDVEDESFEPTRVRSRDSNDIAAANGGVRDLKPLPLELVRRRATIPASTVLPPSLIGFLRKNVGKDLSTIAMPVSANEPLSLLQRLSEQLEYSELLDEAVNTPLENGERLLYVAAFATSSFSNCRVKERSIRKPFNPMLGETFELVREDKGFRFVAEKVSHRPVIMACHADAQHWTYTQSPMPTQKFWGKSAELNTTGRVRVHFPSTGDSFSWTIATSFLRNIIAGEKYVEPVGTMNIHHENTGEKAVVTFKANKGMFSGRSEEVTIAAFDASGSPHPFSLIGKWTESLSLYSEHTKDPLRTLWTIGALVETPQTRFGFTTFAAGLNEITNIENAHLPRTDSRLRPDQRMVEEGLLDEAEEVKQKLEEAQRARRREMDERGETWAPRWFSKVKEYADEEVWKICTGKDGYWEQRNCGQWTGVQELF